MRLIDADALKEKFKEHYNLFVGDYKGEHMSLTDKLRADEILNSMAEVINAPTVFDTDNVTNGDVIKTLFPNERIGHCEDCTDLGDIATFDDDWWNALYK